MDEYTKQESSSSKYYAFAAVFAVIFVAAGALTEGLKLRDGIDPQEVAWNLLTILGVLAILLERALELYVTTWRQPDRPKVLIPETKLKELKKELEEASDADRIELEKDVNDAELKLSQTKVKLEIYRAATQRGINVVMVLGAIAIAAIAPRVLSEFYPLDELGGVLIYLANVVDIVITAGLIGGGAKGMNSVTTVLANFNESLAVRAKAGANSSA